VFLYSQRLCIILSVVAKVGQVRPPVLMVGPARTSMTGTLNAFLEALPLEVLPLEVEDRKFYIHPAGQTLRSITLSSDPQQQPQVEVQRLSSLVILSSVQS